MARIEQTVEIAVPREDFYRLITDFDSYPTFLSDVLAVNIQRQEESVYDVEFTVRVIRKLQYVLRLVGTPHEGLTWSFLGGRLFKRNDGGWKLTDCDIGTRAVYTIDIEVKAFVPKAIINQLVGITLPSMLDQWKQRAESIQLERDTDS